MCAGAIARPGTRERIERGRNKIVNSELPRSEYWRLELLGGFRARSGDREITRFRTRRTASLLAYLAFHLRRSHPREGLAELFWPEAEPEAGRNSLKTALSSLRRQIEPPGTASGSVLVATSADVRLNPETLRVDTVEFQETLEKAGVERPPAEQAKLLLAAAEMYGGELLPGFYDDWIHPRRAGLAEAYLGALRRLTRLYE